MRKVIAVRELPVGIQTFSEIIKGGYVYADKTGYIADLAARGKYFFLSRPRRFGKSLFVDTLNEAFAGNRDLFTGLALAGSDFDFTPSPVVRLDFSRFSVATPGDLTLGLTVTLSRIAGEYQIELPVTNPSLMLDDLILALARTRGARVVVLIDEYDKPIIDHLTDPVTAEANRDLLRSVFGVLKALDAHLRFVFLTGVSKFSRTSLFSQLNNLTDISLRKPYVNICGISEAEFDLLFAEHLTKVAGAWHQQGLAAGDPVSLRKLLFTWYDGYSWDGQSRVFNPFSLLSFFASGEVYPYWYTSGIPRFLIDRMVGQPVLYAQIQDAEITEVDLDSHDVVNASLPSLLFQTGFLTVKSVDESQWPRLYRLGFPNVEVSTSFARNFLMDLAGERQSEASSWSARMRRSLNNGQLDLLQDCLTGLFATIPYNLHQPQESFYHAIFLAVTQFLGFQIAGEVAVAGGEIDGTIDTLTGKSYVIEMKYAKTAPDAADAVVDQILATAADHALAQIEAKRYADKYAGTGLDVYKVAIAVTGRGRVHTAWAHQNHH